MERKNGLCLVLLVLLLIHGVASAGYVEFRDKHFGRYVRIHGAVDLLGVYAGSFTINFYPNSDSANGETAIYYAFCADPSTSGHVSHAAGILSPDFYGFTFGGVNPASDAGLKAAWLVDQFAAEAIHPTQDDPYAYGAALQIALWEVFIENPLNGYDVTQTACADFYVSNCSADIIDMANGFLESLSGNYNAADVPPGVQYIINENPCRDYQAFLVPEPVTLTLLGLGAFFVRKRRP